MHDGDHEIIEAQHKHGHKSNQTIKIVAGVIVAVAIVAFIVWEVIS